MTIIPDAVFFLGAAHSPSFEQLRELMSQYAYPYIVGVDRGALKLINRGIELDLAIGDFDSVTPQEKAIIKNRSLEFKEASPQKDDTDLELALLEVKERFPQVEEYFIFGGLGSGNYQSRVDHLLGNIWLGFHPRFHPIIHNLSFVEDGTIIRFYGPGNHEIRPKHYKQYLSVFTMGPVDNLTIKYAAYPLFNANIDFPQAFISNEFLSNRRPINISFDRGMIMVIWQIEDTPNRGYGNLFNASHWSI